jgi:hypothetical protein
MRTFFVAALWVSLFATVAQLPGEEARITACVFVGWLGVAGIYWTFRARNALAALVVGPIALATIWTASLPFISEALTADFLLIAFASGLIWSGVLSVIVLMSRGLGSLYRRLVRKGNLAASPVREMAIGLAAMRILIAGLGFLAALLVTGTRHADLLLSCSLVVDGPLIPIVIDTIFRHEPDTPYGFLILMTLLGTPMYFVLGWVIGRIASRGQVKPLPPPEVSTKGNAKDRCDSTEPLESEPGDLC